MNLSFNLKSLTLKNFVKFTAILASSNPEINPGLFEGDIAGFHPNAVEFKYKFNNKQLTVIAIRTIQLQGSFTPESYKWPGGVIVYQIDAVLSEYCVLYIDVGRYILIILYALYYIQ